MKTIESFGKILACSLYVSRETEFTNWPGFCNMSTPCLGYYKQLITQCYTILGMYLVYTDNNKGIILYVKEGSDYYKLELYSMSELKTLDTFTCQRPVFSLGVSQHMHTMTNLWNFFCSIGHRSCKKEHPHYITLCDLRCIIKGFSWNFLLLEWEITSLSKTTLLQKERVLTMLYTINSSPMLVSYQVSFYANNCFEYLPIVSSASTSTARLLARSSLPHPPTSCPPQSYVPYVPFIGYLPPYHHSIRIYDFLLNMYATRDEQLPRVFEFCLQSQNRHLDVNNRERVIESVSP